MPVVILMVSSCKIDLKKLMPKFINYVLKNEKNVCYLTGSDG